MEQLKFIKGRRIDRPSTSPSNDPSCRKPLKVAKSGRRFRPPSSHSSTSSSPLSVYRLEAPNNHVKGMTKKRKKKSKLCPRKKKKNDDLSPPSPKILNLPSRLNMNSRLKQLSSKLSTNNFKDSFEKDSFSLSQYSSPSSYTCSSCVHKRSENLNRKRPEKKKKTEDDSVSIVIGSVKKKKRKHCRRCSLDESIHSELYETTRSSGNGNGKLNQEEEMLDETLGEAPRSEKSETLYGSRKFDVEEEVKEEKEEPIKEELKKRIDEQQEQIENLKGLVGEMVKHCVMGTSTVRKWRNRYDGLIPSDLDDYAEEGLSNKFHGKKRTAMTFDHLGCTVFQNSRTFDNRQ